MNLHCVDTNYKKASVEMEEFVMNCLDNTEQPPSWKKLVLQ